MSKYIPDNQKHLTLDERIYIQNELSKGTSFKDIACFLCKDPRIIKVVEGLPNLLRVFREGLA